MKDVGHYVCRRINSIRANHVEHTVTNELLPSLRIVDWRIGAEVASQLGGSRSSALVRNSIAPGKSLVVKKEKSAILYNRSANCHAELVLNELRARNTTSVVEEIVGVQNRITQVFVSGSVKGVRSRSRCKRNNASRKSAEFRTRHTRHNPELLNYILRRHQDSAVAQDFV